MTRRAAVPQTRVRGGDLLQLRRTMHHESPEEIGFYPRCQWTFCTNEAMVILYADVSNGDPQGEQQVQMIYACTVHYGVWAHVSMAAGTAPVGVKWGQSTQNGLQAMWLQFP